MPIDKAYVRERELELQETRARYERHWRTRVSRWLHRAADEIGLPQNKESGSGQDSDNDM